MIEVVPITFEDAAKYVEQFHRHHDPPIGHKFSVAIADAEIIRGCAMIGRPISRHLDDGWTLEVTRCCTDGVRNGCSMLYRAAWRAARALGYRRLITYTLTEERGASLRGAGFKLIGSAGGGSWSCRSRPRVDHHPLQEKLRWELAA